MTPSLLRAAGEALYGARWQTPLAADLAVADRTVRRWAAGDNPIPPGVGADLARILTARRDDMAGLIEKLRR